ncbi:MAG: deoxyribonuclease IV [Thermoplasmata archaeon]
MNVTEKILLGGHISTSGGISKAPVRAAVFGFRTMQIFSKNQMQWNAKPLPDEEIAMFKSEYTKVGLRKTMSHASYLLNLGSPNKEMKVKVKDAMQLELSRANVLGIDYVILHPGSQKDTTERAAITQMSEILDSVLSASSFTKVLIENAAGQGSAIGYQFRQISEIIDGISQKDMIGVCIDTCHVFAAGYDVKTPEGYAETMDRFNSEVGLKYLLGFHLNDSKKEQGSRLDRHEQIGKGLLGLDGIKNFVNDKRFSDIPMVLETPKGEEGYADDIKAIESVME